MTYKEWIIWLEQRSLMPKVAPGLEKTQTALKEANLRLNPEKTILIAGTNGKGTTAKTLEQLLVHAKQNVGLFTSPHLISTCERIRVSNRQITEQEFVGLCEKYQNLIENLKLSHFESLTLFAVDFFQAHKTDWNIFEVGLGGTWDSTNAIEHNYSVITPIGYDHQNILGNTLEEIASNKFGIIQTQNKVFHFEFPDNLKKIYANRTQQQFATDFCIPPSQQKQIDQNHLPRYQLTTPWGEANLSLVGIRAAQNSWLALNVFKHLGFDPAVHLQALNQISWPGRMSQLQIESPAPIYLSGDHNEQGVLSLIDILKNAKYQKLHLLMGVSKDRDILHFIHLIEQLPKTSITLTQPSFMGTIPKTQTYPFYTNSQQALNLIMSKANKDDLIVVTGSLYLCGDILTEYS